MHPSLQMIINMSFAKRLAAVRKGREWTQQEMANVIEIHLSQVKRYESGDTQPSLDVLCKIARALNISADRLLFDENERGPDDGLKLQFEAVSQFSREEKKIAKVVLDGLILQHHANHLAASR